ncbi:MAG TPA: hypothetical protein VE650_06810 [Acetobacteraceae bacterium]|nr:hypothetical protein [Acetobacteraceae bacterium]
MNSKLGNAKPGTPTHETAPPPDSPKTVAEDLGAKDRDEPGPGDREKLEDSERESFEAEAMRERDA